MNILNFVSLLILMYSIFINLGTHCSFLQDYNQQRPSQELVATDLLGQKWKFRHIYRGMTWESLIFGALLYQANAL